MGTVATRDAQVSGSLAVQNDRTTLLSNAAVTSYDHNAPITLARGGQALVCANSAFHMLHAGTGNALLFGLDRGGVELFTQTQPMDMVLTPDIRFTVEAPGQLDLRLRVNAGGDTCVENRGDHAPVLLLSSSFAGGTYRLLPGQHVLFERGDLRTVVDNERASCGCPPSAATAAQRAALEHPFPEAQSSGVVPETMPSPDGSMSISADGSTKPHRGFFGSIGHFFKRIFGAS